MMPRALRPFLVCAALGAIPMAATSAFATGEPPKVQMREVPAEGGQNRVAPITVEAAQPNELRKQTFGFVQTFAATSVKLDQVARWTQPICVTVKGLPAQAADEVRLRVEEVASALKLKVEKPGCPPDIQVLFTDQPQALLDKVARNNENLLGYWHHKDRDKLKQVTHPVQAWYVTGTAGGGADTAGLMFMTVETYAPSGASMPGPTAIPAAGSSVAAAAGRQPHGVRLDDEDDPRGPTGCGENTHFTACLSSEFQHVLVVVDTSKAGAYPPGLIADYVVMVAMAQPRSLDGCNILPSVIDLFSKDCPGRSGQDGLTRADVAYLTALYKMDLQGKKGAQMSDIAGRMADMLIKANKADQLTIQAAAASSKK
jgi:hypothetical protein